MRTGVYWEVHPWMQVMERDAESAEASVGRVITSLPPSGIGFAVVT